MRSSLKLWFLSFLLIGCGVCVHPAAAAPVVIHGTEFLDPDRPEAWAMNYAAAATFMTSFGESPTMAPGQWLVATEFGYIPPLDEDQRRVGFNGFKREDLNKSPVFGRIRGTLGLPAGWIAELGYTPPVTINGTRTHNLVALAFGHRLIERGSKTLSVRVFGQHGSVQGDITCPADLAGVSDPEHNPFGCQAASHDEIALNYYGLDMTTGWGAGPWRWHADAGVVRTELEVQVDALVFDYRDRSRLVARDVLPYFAFGASRAVGPHLSLGLELLHVPLTVQRDPAAASGDEPMNSFRLQLRYRAD